jgi:hypothetical protein
VEVEVEVASKLQLQNSGLPPDSPEASRILKMGQEKEKKKT